MTTPAFEAARELLAERLRARERFHRAKALEAGQFPEKWLTRADECRECAEIAAHLSPEYSPPSEPDMRLARASRKAGG